MALEKPTFLQQEKKVENPKDYIFKSFPGIENEILEFYEKNKDKVKSGYLEQAASFYQKSLKESIKDDESREKAIKSIIANLENKAGIESEGAADKKQLELNLKKHYGPIEMATMGLEKKTTEDLEKLIAAIEGVQQIAIQANDKLRMNNLDKWKTKVTDELAARIKQAM